MLTSGSRSHLPRRAANLTHLGAGVCWCVKTHLRPIWRSGRRTSCMNESTQSDENAQAPWPEGMAAITRFVEDLAAAKDFYTDVASHTGSDRVNPPRIADPLPWRVDGAPMGPQPGALRSLQETAPPPGYRQAACGQRRRSITSARAAHWIETRSRVAPSGGPGRPEPVRRPRPRTPFTHGRSLVRPLSQPKYPSTRDPHELNAAWLLGSRLVATADIARLLTLDCEHH